MIRPPCAGFAGTLSGYVSLCVSYDAALEIAQALLGSEADEAPAHVRDAAGEMANMIAGSVRTAMADRGAHSMFVYLVLQGKGLA